MIVLDRYPAQREREQIGQGLGQAWESGDWAGFFYTAIGAVNRNYNPLHAAAEHGYYAYFSGKFNDWRAAFKHGTIATILTVLTIVTTAKGVSGAVKKGGAAGLGAAEEAAAWFQVQALHR